MDNIEEIKILISTLAKKDQEIAKNPNTTYKDLIKREKEIFPIIKKIIDEHGLITISKFGKECSHLAWLLIQHISYENIDFKIKYLKMMEENSNDVSKIDLAYLQDKVLIMQNQKQIYGTQFKPTKTKNLYFCEMEDLENIDEIRKKVGMQPLKEYAEQSSKIYYVKVHLPKKYKSI